MTKRPTYQEIKALFNSRENPESLLSTEFVDIMWNNYMEHHGSIRCLSSSWGDFVDNEMPVLWEIVFNCKYPSLDRYDLIEVKNRDLVKDIFEARVYFTLDLNGVLP